MTATHTRLIAPLVVALLLAACATPGGRLQSAGTIEVFDMQIDSALDWSRIKGRRQETWTIDGTALNRLLICSGIKPDEHVFQMRRKTKAKPDGPWYRAGLRPDEIRDVVLDALREGAWTNIESTELRPATFGTVEGMRFDFAMHNSGGLRYAGTAAAAEHNGTLTLVLWFAPAEHYHGRDVEAVRRMFDTLRFKS